MANSEDFQTLLTTHPAAKHPFFDFLNEKAAIGLSASEYNAFAINYAARTAWTIPEVAAAGLQAAIDFRVKATAYSAATLFEEGGEGNPEKAHSMLMQNALNYHGKAVYGDDFNPVDIKKILDVTSAAYFATQAMAFQALDDTAVQQLKQRGIFDFSAIDARLNRTISDYLPGTDTILSSDNAKPHYAGVALALISELKSMGVCDEVIAYGFEQMDVMRSPVRGKLAGTAFAHEGFADGMMLQVFKILQASMDKYPGGKEEFDDNVYEYFSAHGDYYAMARGDFEVNQGSGVEAVHAKREIEKIKELSPEMLEAAYKGAEQFAERQSYVWDAIMRAMIEAAKENTQEQTIGKWAEVIKKSTLSRISYSVAAA